MNLQKYDQVNWQKLQQGKMNYLREEWDQVDYQNEELVARKKQGWREENQTKRQMVEPLMGKGEAKGCQCEERKNEKMRQKETLFQENEHPQI